MLQIIGTGRDYMSISLNGLLGLFAKYIGRVLFALGLFFAVLNSASAESLNKLVAAEYYIDNIPGLGGGERLVLDTDEQFNVAYIVERINGTDLSVGVHTLSIRYQAEDGEWSPAIHQSFYWPGYNGPIGNNSAINPIIKGEVFFDNDSMEAGTGIDISLAADGYVDTGFERLQRIAGIRGLSPGTHSVSLKLLDSSGIWSKPLSQTFFVYGHAEPGEDFEIIPDNTYAGDNNNQGWFFPSRISHVTNAIAYYNNDPSVFVEIPIPSPDPLQQGSALSVFDAAASAENLANETHSLHIRFQDNVGEWSQAIAQTILINPTHNNSVGNIENRLIAARYSVNGQSPINIESLDGEFDDQIETIETQIALTDDYQSVEVNFLDLSGHWSNPLNNVSDTLQNDVDGNGIPDQWELSWFGQVGIDPLADHDNDGVSNIDEFLLGKNPLVPNDQTGLTISGYVKDQNGNGIEHVLVCLDSQSTCTVRTDSFGHYILGLGDGLASQQYTVSVRATSASGLYAFSSPQTVSLEQEPITRLNFSSTPLELSWSFVANERYNFNEAVLLNWQSNLGTSADIVVELKTDGSEGVISEPDNVSWYRFSTFSNNAGTVSINIPEGLLSSDDWRLSLHIDGTDEPVLRSGLFQIGHAVPDVPIVDIDTLGVTQLAVGELFTAKTINLDDTKAISRSYWRAIKLLEGAETSQTVMLGEGDTLLTDHLSQGDWRLVLQAQDEEGQWSAAATKDLYVTPIEGLADLAISQTGIQIINSDGEATYTVEPGENLSMQITISNEGAMGLPDVARLIVKSGFGDNAPVLGVIDVPELAPGASRKLSLPLVMQNEAGYQNLTAELQFVRNLEPDLIQPVVAESNRFNNAASVFVIVGSPPPGNFGIELSTSEVYTVYPGQSVFVDGQANYGFGARVPLMGTEVFVEFEDSAFTGRTTSPAGNFAVSVKAPMDIGDYQTFITVNGGYIPPARKQVVLRVIPWPTIDTWKGCTVCRYTPPRPPSPVIDAVIDRVRLSGEGVYTTDTGVKALLQNTDAAIVARVYNIGNVDIESSFKVSFFYQADNQDTALTALGEPVIVESGLAVDKSIEVSANATFASAQLGYRQVTAHVTALSNEQYTDNNTRSASFDIRQNLPDLRGNIKNNLRFSNTRPVEGETVRVFADVVNRGPAVFSDTFTVNFYQSNADTRELIDSATYSGTLEPWQSVTLEVNYPALTAGAKLITAEIDEANNVLEDTESNNTVSGSLVVLPDAEDLFVYLGLSDYSVTPGATISLNANINNRGSQPSEASSVRFYVGGGATIATQELASLASKSNRVLSNEWTVLLPQGQHSICAIIESNERTSCRTLSISDIPTPDLQIFSEDISYTPSPYPSLNDSVVVSAEIRNVSAYRNARDITVQFYADSPNGFFEIGQAVRIDELALLESTSVTASASFTADQPYYALLVNVSPSAADGDANVSDNAATLAFSVNGYTPINAELPEDFPTIVSLNEVEDSDPSNNIYRYSVTLSDELPFGYGVFLNFDDQQGEWFAQTDAGGHIQMSANSGNEYSLIYQMVKPGLRSFRAGIFDLQDLSTPVDDILVVGYTDYRTCTLDSCKDSLSDLVTSTTIGNPALSNSGSQLFKNVDVATGNYHYAANDMAVKSAGPSFSMTRAYNSLSPADSPWSFAYEMTVKTTDEFARRVVIGPREDGRLQHYFKDMDQKWYALNPGNFDQLIEENGQFVLYTKGNRVYRFEQAQSADSTGKLLAIEDRLGNALRFSYSDGLLNGATDASGNVFTISRDNQNRIKRVSDFTNRYVEYSYNANGMLSNVTDLRGNQHSYAYGTEASQSKLLSSMTDQRGIQQVAIDYNSANQVTELVQGTETVEQITTQFIYAHGSGEVYTAVIQPEVDDVNHNIVYFIDNDGVRITQRIDADNYDEFLASRSDNSIDYSAKSSNYSKLVSRNRLAEQSLVTQSEDLIGSLTSVIYSDDGKGNPVEVKFVGTNTQASVGNLISDNTNLSNANSSNDRIERTTLKSYAQESAVSGQYNLTPVTSVTLPSASDELITTQFQDFTQTGLPSTVINALGNSVSYEYENQFNLVSSMQNGRGFSVQYDKYDANGNIEKIVDAQGNVSTKTYDSLSRLVEEVSPLGLTTTYTYFEPNLIKTKTVRDTEGVASNGNSGISYTWSYFYSSSNKLIKEIDPKGHETNYVYDDLNRLIEKYYTVNGEVFSYKTEYDLLGRIVKTINPLQQATSTSYTSRNEVSTKTNALDEPTLRYTYDKNGNVNSITDAEGRTTTITYDAFNRKIELVDDEMNIQKWSYNEAGHIQKYTDSRGFETQYEYDLLGNVTKVTDANGGITTSSYDENNNLTRVVGPNGQVTNYVYDELDRRISTLIAHGAEEAKWQYDYDANGNIIRESKPTGEFVLRAYDALNRMVEVREFDASSQVTRQIAYTYDANNNITSKTEGENTISYAYDAINRTTAITDHFGQTVRYEYDKAGNRTALIYPGDKRVSYSFDKANRLISVSDWLNKTTRYTLNKAGQVAQTINGNNSIVNYQYDEAGRLVLLENLSADGTIISKHQLTLDGNGNITNSSANLPLQPELPNNFVATYDTGNRILSADNRSFTHDSSGRIVEQSDDNTQTIYEFDINNQLRTISDGFNTLSAYEYDANNNRISQTQFNNGVATETRYVIDQLANLPNVVAETNSQGEANYYYVYGYGLISQIDAANNTHYYHYNPTGHTLALSDADSNTTDNYAYTPYGKTNRIGQTHNPFLFVGKHGVMDDGNGLHFMRARYYKQDIKRFMSLDELHGEVLSPQSLNRYAYVLGNPIMGIDPSGLFCHSILDPNIHNTKILSGDITYAEFGVDGCLDASREFFGADFSYTSKLNLVDLSTDDYKVGDAANGYSSSLNVSVDISAGTEGYYKNNDAGDVELKGNLGGCTNAKGEIGAELFGLRVKPSFGKTAGVCIGGQINGYSDELYTGASLGGQAAAVVGLNVDLDIAVNRKYWDEKHNQVKYGLDVLEQTISDSLYNFQQLSPFRGY